MTTTPPSYPLRLRGTLFVLLFLLMFAAPVFAGDWQGTETVTAAGVIHVQNPADPLEGSMTGELMEAWRIGGETDDEDEIFGLITRVRVDDNGDLYLLDAQLNEIRVFDADGNFLRAIGREGEGPGEFRNAADFFFTKDGNIVVMQLVPGRLVQLSKDGEPGDDLLLPSAPEGGFVLLTGGGGFVGDNLVTSIGINAFADGILDREMKIIEVDADGEILQTIHSENRHLELANAVFDEKMWNSYDRVWDVNYGRAYIPVGWGDYGYRVFDGEQIRFVQRAYEPRKRTAEESSNWQTVYDQFTGQVPNSRWEIAKYDRDVQRIFPREDGSVWILGSRGVMDRPDGTLGVFDVFDAEGRYTQQVTLAGDGDPFLDGFFFAGDRLYVVTDFMAAAMSAGGGDFAAAFGDEDEPEPMSVICYELGKIQVGMN